MKKVYVLDTNVLLSDPNSLNAFEDNDVIVPLVVLEELDAHKNRQDEVGRNARTVSRQLDSLREKSSLVDGVALPSGGTLRVCALGNVGLPIIPELEKNKVDNLLIAFMQFQQKIHDVPVILVTKDINVRIKCDALLVKSEDYLNNRVTDSLTSLYTGVTVVETSKEDVDSFFINGQYILPSECGQIFPNQIVIIKNTEDGTTTQSAITKCVDVDRRLLRPLMKIDSAFGMFPRNKEQKFSLDLLFDDNIKLLTLVGPAGCGKTLMALAASLAQLKGFGNDGGKYTKLIISRPVQPMGKDIGFLPGTLNEKMEPWIAPIKDNLGFLFGQQKKTYKGAKVGKEDEYMSLMQENGLIEIEALAFIRGRSIPNAILLIDEAQNLTPHELKTIITRVGDGTKVILTGDLEQIDNVHVDTYTNGLTYAIEKFKDCDIAGHVTLLKGERSKLATIASKIL